MRRLVLILFAFGTSVLAASFDEPGVRYVVTYYDQDHDGRVDLEHHRAVNAVDADWALIDTRGRGRFNLRIRYRTPVVRELVNLPVRKGVQITPGRPPVYKLP
jgi:hypothetical protein